MNSKIIKVYNLLIVWLNINNNFLKMLYKLIQWIYSMKTLRLKIQVRLQLLKKINMSAIKN